MTTCKTRKELREPGLRAYLEVRPRLTARIRGLYAAHVRACRRNGQQPEPWYRFALEIVNAPAKMQAEMLAPAAPPPYEPLCTYPQYHRPKDI